MIMRILICDDEPLMVEVLKNYLAPVASAIDSSETLSGALAMAEHGEYNIIVLDLKFPDSSKEEAFAAIRKFKSFNARVIVVSGSIEDHIKEQSIAAGADAFLQKDQNLNQRAMLVVAHIATLKLPKESFRSDSWLQHVELLKQIAPI